MKNTIEKFLTKEGIDFQDGLRGAIEIASADMVVLPYDGAIIIKKQNGDMEQVSFEHLCFLVGKAVK